MQLQFCVVLPFCFIGPQFWPSVQLLLLFYSTVWFYLQFSDTRHAVVARSAVPKHHTLRLFGSSW